jgi:FOG: GGDEF domain
MIALDATTLGLMNGLLVLVCGIAFLVETLIRRSDEVGRLWSMFFLGLIFALFAYLVGAFEPDAWWAYPAGNGAFIAAFGFFWAGARRANGHRRLLLPPLVGAVVVLGAGLLHGPGSGYWTGAAELFVGVAVLSALLAVEFSRGALRRLASARLLSGALALMVLYYGSRTVALLALGPADPFYDSVYGAATSTLIEACLTVLAAITLSSIQADRFRRAGYVDADYGTSVTIDGMLSPSSFRELAESWLVRSIRERVTLVLLLVELADLSEVNLAFGRAAGDAAIRLTGRLAFAHAPTAALVGHLSPRRFALLMELPTGDAVEAIADRIGDAVLSTPIDEHDRFRASTFRGIATTRTTGGRYDDLFRAASDAVAVDKAAARALAEDALGRPEPNLSGN